MAFGRERMRFAHTHHALLSAANRDPRTRYRPPAAVLRRHVRVLLASAETSGDLVVRPTPCSPSSTPTTWSIS